MARPGCSWRRPAGTASGRARCASSSPPPRPTGRRERCTTRWVTSVTTSSTTSVCVCAEALVLLLFPALFLQEPHDEQNRAHDQRDLQDREYEPQRGAEQGEQ